MSLSFVSSAVQTGTSDGGYEETSIENKEAEAVNRRNAHKPLFDQLREKQEEEQVKRDEIQREMMRGTRALDADDVAHLEAIEHQRSERERQIQEQTQDELAQFRAAKALRQAAINEDDFDEVVVDETDVASHYALGLDAATMSSVPPFEHEGGPKNPPLTVPIKVKKRKRRVGGTKEISKAKVPKESVVTKPEVATAPVPEKKDCSNDMEEPAKETNESSAKSSGLSSLLAGYGSSSDED